MPRYKIDSDGNYLPFPGYTVIFKTNSGASDMWHGINEKLLNNKYPLTKYYSILPSESWHVTAINLFTKDLIEDNNLEWDTYVKSQQGFFSQLSALIKQDSFVPVITYSDLRVEGVIQVMVSLDEKTKEKVTALAAHYGYQNNVPQHFHMTLGYQYKNLNNAQFEALKEELAPFIKDCFENMRVALKPAEVCSFDDMTAFIPWDSDKKRTQQLYKHSIFEQPINSDESKNEGGSSSSHDSNSPK